MAPSDAIPTVLIKTANGPVLINECDFDKTKHELVNAPAVDKVAAVAKAPEGQYIVGKNGKPGRGSKFVVLNDKGEKAVEQEFDTEADAYAAIASLAAPAKVEGE